MTQPLLLHFSMSIRQSRAGILLSINVELIWHSFVVYREIC